MTAEPAAKGSGRLLAGVSRWPAVPAAAAFIGGIALHPCVPHQPAAWVVCLALLAVAAAAVRARARAASLLIAGGLMVAGIAAAQAEAFYYPRRHISAFAADRPRLAQLELYLSHPPRIFNPHFDNQRPLPPKQVTTATVVKVRTKSGWEPATGDVLVQLTQPHPRLAVGQTARVLCMIQRPAPAMNPGQFNWAAYYRDQRILASVQITEPGNIRILSDDGPGPWTWLRERARRLLAAGFGPAQSLDHALLRALLLGDNDPELRDVQEQFRRTGTSHHLAISGMHIAVLGAFVWGVCRLLRLRPRRSASIMLAFVVFYGAAALPSPPVVRSVLLCVFFGWGLIRGRALEPVQLLALSVLSMLLYHPLDLYNAGFQLSFGTVLGLMVLAKGYELALRKRDPDERALRGLSKPTPLEALIDWLDRALITALVAGVVAWMVSTPVVMYHFGQLNPWAVLASIVLAPVVFAALIGGLLKVALTLLWPGLAGAWAWLAAWPVVWMRWVVDKLTELPWGDVPVPQPALWAIAIFYGVVFSIHLRVARRGFAAWLAVARTLAVPLLIFLPFRNHAATQSPSAGEVRVTLLAVGAGQCAVIEPPGGRTVLVDAGASSLSDLLAKCLGPYLRRGRYTDVDTVLISHANTDHFSAVSDLVSGYDVREVLTAPGFARLAGGNPATAQLLADLARAERPPREVAPGDRLPLGRDTALEILWPPKDSALALSANDASMVVRLTHAGKRILFTGDIQADAMRELLKRPQALQADVLIAPHHGSSEDTTEAFIRAAAPAFILSSNDRTLTGKQRRFDQITAGMTVYRTHKFGAVTVTVDREGNLKVETFLDEKGQPRE
jgi:competence protein ComEC